MSSLSRRRQWKTVLAPPGLVIDPAPPLTTTASLIVRERLSTTILCTTDWLINDVRTWSWGRYVGYNQFNFQSLIFFKHFNKVNMYRLKHFEIFLCLQQPHFLLSWSINILMLTGMHCPCPRCNVMYESKSRVSTVKPRQQHFPGALSLSMQFPCLICWFAEERDCLVYLNWMFSSVWTT